MAFKMRSGHKPQFKEMGSSPNKNTNRDDWHSRRYDTVDDTVEAYGDGADVSHRRRDNFEYGENTRLGRAEREAHELHLQKRSKARRSSDLKRDRSQSQLIGEGGSHDIKRGTMEMEDPYGNMHRYNPRTGQFKGGRSGYSKESRAWRDAMAGNAGNPDFDPTSKSDVPIKPVVTKPPKPVATKPKGEYMRSDKVLPKTKASMPEVKVTPKMEKDRKIKKESKPNRPGKTWDKAYETRDKATYGKMNKADYIKEAKRQKVSKAKTGKWDVKKSYPASKKKVKVSKAPKVGLKDKLKDAKDNLEK